MKNARPQRGYRPSGPKALLNKKFRRVTAQAVESHGTIGFTNELDRPLHLKRAKV